MSKRFDIELLYVECGKCGQPILWPRGHTTSVIDAAGIDVSVLDERCAIISDGCPSCQPEKTVFDSQIIRMTKKGKAEVVDAHADN